MVHCNTYCVMWVHGKASEGNIVHVINYNSLPVLNFNAGRSGSNPKDQLENSV